MSRYEFESANEQLQKDINNKLKALQKSITICRKVEHTLTTAGWQEMLKPMLDKMISDVVGGKHGDLWNNGLLERAKSDVRKDYYIGYKQALIDFNNRAYDYTTKLVQNEEVVQKILKEQQTSKEMKSPMDSSVYADTQEL